MIKRKYFFIVNPAAGSGNADKAWKQIQHKLNELHVVYQFCYTSHPHEELKLAQKFSQSKFDEDTILVIVGGDGTLHEALNGLYQIKADETVGYIPCGSGNDFARAAKLPFEPLKALDFLLNQKRATAIDIGVYHESNRNITRLFTNNLGIGFDARTAYQTNKSTSKKVINKTSLGVSSYVVSAINALFKQKPFTVSLELGTKKQTIKNAFLTTTTNHPYFGGGVPIMPEVKMTDGKLDLVIVQKKNLLSFISIFAMMLLPGEAYTRRKIFHHYQASAFKMQIPSTQYGQADGEVLQPGPFDLEFSIYRQKIII